MFSANPADAAAAVAARQAAALAAGPLDSWMAAVAQQVAAADPQGAAQPPDPTNAEFVHAEERWAVFCGRCGRYPGCPPPSPFTRHFPCRAFWRGLIVVEKHQMKKGRKEKEAAEERTPV